MKTLAAEVMAHLREVAGPEALLGAYNAARAAVESQRTTRRTRQKLEVRVHIPTSSIIVLASGVCRAIAAVYFVLADARHGSSLSGARVMWHLPMPHSSASRAASAAGGLCAGRTAA